MSTRRTIDTHAHFFPERFLELVARHGPRCGATVRRWQPGQ